MGLGQYDSLGEYCGPHTVFSVFLILVVLTTHNVGVTIMLWVDSATMLQFPMAASGQLIIVKGVLSARYHI